MTMKTNKEYRFESNPKEKEFHDKFKALFDSDGNEKTTLSGIIFGWNDNNNRTFPKDYLTGREEDICLNLIQWLGSPVGQAFLNMCGFKIKQ